MAALALLEIVTGVTALILLFGGLSISFYGFKEKFIPNLALGFSMLALTVMFFLDLRVGLLTSSEETMARFLLYLGTLFTILVNISFILYNDRILGQTISPRTLFGLAIGCITFGYILNEPWDVKWSLIPTGTDWVYGWVLDPKFEFSLLLAFLLSFTIGNFLLSIWPVYKKGNLNQRQRKILLAVMVVVLIFGVGGGLLIVILEEVLSITKFILSLLMFCVGFVQFFDPFALYFVRVKIDVCGITSDSGIPYVTYIPELFDVSMGVSAIRGIQALIKEIISTGASLKIIDTGDKKILFEYKNINDAQRIIAFLIADIETTALRKALKTILTTFKDKYEDELEDLIDTERFKPFKDEIEQILSPFQVMLF
ncbi:MAG: hypothetical protein ACFFC7_20330 [Candidatus Hermodarchaeota archaeon]